MPSNELEGTLRGSAEEGAFSVFQISEGRLRSVLSVNAPRDIKVARRWLRQGACPPPEVLADRSVRLDKL